VVVHLPVASQEDRRMFARNIVDAVRAAKPTRVVFSTSGYPIDPAADVAEAYRAMSALPGRSITPEHSAQKLLGTTPWTTSQWPADIGL
jgi:hypothetical protein